MPDGSRLGAAVREGRFQNQQNHQRLLNAASALFARAKLARFCSAPMAQRIVMVRFKRRCRPAPMRRAAYGLGPWASELGQIQLHSFLNKRSGVHENRAIPDDTHPPQRRLTGRRLA